MWGRKLPEEPITLKTNEDWGMWAPTDRLRGGKELNVEVSRRVAETSYRQFSVVEGTAMAIVGVRGAVPYVFCADAGAVADWCIDVLGFDERDR